MIKTKKIKLITSFFLIICFIIFFSMKEKNDTDTFGKVILVTGKVTIQKLGSDENQDLKINTIILLGDTIETFEESKAEILLTDNKTKVIIMGKTRVKLSSLLNPEKKKQTIISIFFGSITSLVQQLTGSTIYVIQTPNGTASVRGTEFSVSVSDTLDTSVVVTEGTVAYQKEENGQTLNISQNQYCVTEIDSPPQISEGSFDNQSWLTDRNNQFEQNSQEKSEFVIKNLFNIVKLVANLINEARNFSKESLIFKLLKGNLTPSDIFKFLSQKKSLVVKVYEFYYRLNLFDTTVLGFYRFFDFLSRFNDNFNEEKQKCWEIHLELSTLISKILQIYRAIWFLY